MSETLELRQGKIVLLTEGAPVHVSARGILAWDVVGNKLYIQKTGPTGSDWEEVAEVTMTTIGAGDLDGGVRVSVLEFELGGLFATGFSKSVDLTIEAP
jgi:hypothetical protein